LVLANKTLVSINKLSGETMRKLILITGGTSGLGRAIADILVDKYDLALGYRDNTARSEKVVLELSKICPDAKIRTYKVLLDGYESSKTLYDNVVRDFPKNQPYGFIHCAGRTSTQFFVSSEFESQSNLIQEHLISGMALAHLCLPSMYANKSGRIIFMSSIAAKYAFRGHTGYAAAMSGLEAFTRTLALEVAHRGITVNCVAPGLIETALTEEKIKKLDQAEVQKVNPIGSLPKPHDVASLVQYLFLSETRFITGTTIPVDGGQSLGDPES
jgi:3-oxoacyl-[acyl-carrier protein] reductase